MAVTIISLSTFERNVFISLKNLVFYGQTFGLFMISADVEIDVLLSFNGRLLCRITAN